MRVGMNLLLWTTEVGPSHRKLLKQIRDWGFDGVEIPIFSPHPQRARDLGLLLDDLGLERTAVTVVPPDANPIHPDPSVRTKALEYLKSVVEACHLAGIRLLAGPLHSPVGLLAGRSRTQEEWRWAPGNPATDGGSGPVRADHAGSGIPEPVRILFPELRQGHRRVHGSGRSAQSGDSLRHLPRPSGGEERLHGDSVLCGRPSPRPHQRERPGDPRRGSGPLAGDLRHSQGRPVCGLAGHRGLRAGDAGTGRRHLHLAAHVPVRRASGAKRNGMDPLQLGPTSA